MFAWQNAAGTPFLAIGTNEKLTAIQSTNFISASSGGQGGDEGGNDITPERSTGVALTDPFSLDSIMNGVATFTVADTAHGASDGDWVVYSGASAVEGITIDGEYKITTINDTDSYEIQHAIGSHSLTIPAANLDLTSENPAIDDVPVPRGELALTGFAPTVATSSVTAGGSVTADHQISIGGADAVFGYGYGVGNYGVGTYGTPRASFLASPPRTWSLHKLGVNLLAMPYGGNLYKWELSLGTRAQLVANAPTDNCCFFVTEEEHVVALGAGGNPMRVEWSDQSDETTWTPDSTNTAGGRTLTEGSIIVGGQHTRGQNLIWTDSAIYTMTFIGGLDVFGFREESSGAAGLAGPHATVDVDGVVYWMGGGDFFYFDGAVRRVRNSNDIRQFVFNGLDNFNQSKVYAGHNSRFNEIWWFYPTEDEITRYVKYNYDDNAWDVGTVVRTAMMDRGVYELPIMAGADQYLYNHETGVDADGAAMNEFIKSSPMEIDDQNRWVEMHSIFPDFKDLAGAIEFELFTKEYPQSTEQPDGVFTVVSGTEDLDTRASGRQIAWKVGSKTVGTNWRGGTLRFDVTPGGDR
jgi:hypothetical protein